MRRRNSVTITLLVVQIAVFLIGYTDIGSYLVYGFGVKDGEAIALGGQYWRLVTPIFIHFGLEHILFNSITLYFLGNQVEEILGSWRFLLLYLLSGVMGNLFSYQFSPALSAGASTSLFGLFAYFVAMDYLEPGSPYFRAMGQQYKVLLFLNIISNLFSSGIDIWGHLGGVVGGFLGTMMLRPWRGATRDAQFFVGLGVYLVIAAAILVNGGILHRFI